MGCGGIINDDMPHWFFCISVKARFLFAHFVSQVHYVIAAQAAIQ